LSYSDKTLTCRTCGMSFVFEAHEQEFYAQKGFTNEPSRCPSCRAARKSANDRSHSRAGFGTDSRREPREMHAAVCSACGQEALVPFVPRGDKPIYCSTCFDKVRSYGR